MKDKYLRERELLKLLYRDMEEVELEPGYFEDAVPGSHTDMIRTFHEYYGEAEEGVYGEYYFMPSAPDEEAYYFTAALTLVDEIKEECIPDLAEALSKLSFYMPVGTFCLNKTGQIVVYKVSEIIAADLDKEAAVDLMNRTATHAIAVPERYVIVLRQLATGNLSMEQFLMLF